MRNATILVGIPTSGKSTWAKKQITTNTISRDNIRLKLFGTDYKQNSKDEIKVTVHFNVILQKFTESNLNVIIDNCHCKESYLNEAIKHFEYLGYNIKIKFFDITLWNAYYRNVIRRIFTGKWIPIKVIKNMKANYDKIDKSKYEHYKY